MRNDQARSALLYLVATELLLTQYAERPLRCRCKVERGSAFSKALYPSHLSIIVQHAPTRNGTTRTALAGLILRRNQS